MHLDTLSAGQTSRGKNIFTQQGSARTPSKRNLRFLSHCTILYVLVQQWFCCVGHRYIFSWGGFSFTLLWCWPVVWIHRSMPFYILVHCMCCIVARGLVLHHKIGSNVHIVQKYMYTCASKYRVHSALVAGPGWRGLDLQGKKAAK